jgi:hypothetical protein
VASGGYDRQAGRSLPIEAAAKELAAKIELREKAIAMRLRAQGEKDTRVRNELVTLATDYEKLAEAVDREDRRTRRKPD